MKQISLLFIALTIGIVCLSAQNHMDLMTTIYGEFIGSYFGRSVVSLDYNGDGYDDLVVASSLWNPTGVFNEAICYGKIYFYWGGPGFDNVPDFVIEGTYEPQFGDVIALVSAGDLNNDGFDDLAISTYNPDRTMFLGLHLGRLSPMATPDIVWSAPEGLEFSVYSLGDINFDEKDDLSITYEIPSNNTRHLYVWDDIYSQPYQFHSSDWSPYGLLGIGDVNGDDIEDCHLSEPIYGQYNHFRKLVYFGTTEFPLADSLVLENDIFYPDPRASALGDLNNDGYDDFSSYGRNIHLGSSNLSQSPSFSLITPSTTWSSNNNIGLRMVYGDFNGDGYDDMVASDHTWSYYDGDVIMWLGGPNVNGTYDLRFYAPELSSNFGYSKAAGDFNGDGLCDLAISAPYYYWGSSPMFEQGKVFIFSGNATLADTTVGINDELIPELSCEIIIYPNPLPKSGVLANVELSGKELNKSGQLSLEMFNLKGQLIKTWVFDPDKSGQGRYQINCEGIATGIYFILARQSGEKLGSTKLLVY